MNFWKFCTASQYSVCLNSLRSSLSPLSYIAVFTEKRDSNFCDRRADVHDAACGPLPLLIRSQKRREGLDYDKWGDHVDLQLPPVLDGPQIQERSAHYNSCTVHQA